MAVVAALGWRRLWLIAVWLVRAGQRFRKNLTGEEWQELFGLVSKGMRGKSKRTPWRNLRREELERLRSLVFKAIAGWKGGGRRG